MKVALINGSPHKTGCTFTALEEVAKSLNKNGIDTEIVYLGHAPVPGCIGCGVCRVKGHCYIDDIVNVFADSADQYDGFIFGSPVHYASTSASIKGFMDRLFYSAGSKFGYKPAAAVISCRRAGSTCAFDEINKYFTINCMPVVSSQYWNTVHGATSEDVMHDLEGLQTMRLLGNNMAWMLKNLEAGRSAGILIPEREERIWTNFVR